MIYEIIKSGDEIVENYVDESLTWEAAIDHANGVWDRLSTDLSLTNEHDESKDYQTDDMFFSVIGALVTLNKTVTMEDVFKVSK